MKVRYLYHSGFTVETEGHFLIFDYFSGSRPFFAPLETGGMEPEAFPEKPVLYFSSHAHGDHYDRRIFQLAEKRKDITFVISNDIPKETTLANVLRPGPGEVLKAGDVLVRTLKSTDEGIAFLVKVDGHTIYHAGDLNWWYWEGEPEEDNRTMGEAYCMEIDKLKGETVDAAFLTMDPRQEQDYLRGLIYFMDTVGAKEVFPMHFGEDYRAFDWFENDPGTEKYRNAVHRIHHRGELFQL